MLSTILDAAVIVIVLIAFIVGLARGFFKSIWGLVALACFTALMFVTTTPISKQVIDKTQLDEKIAVMLEKPLGSLPGMSFEFEYPGEAQLEQALIDAGVSSSVIKNYSPMVIKHATVGQMVSFKQVVAKEYSLLVTVAITGIALSIVYGIVLYGIVFRLLRKMFEGLTKTAVIKPVDKILGIVFQVALIGAILISLGGVAHTLSHKNFMAKVNQASQSSKVFKYIYGENPFQNIFNSKLDLSKFIK